MSIATVVTRGFGSFGTIGQVVTAGYSIGDAVVVLVPLFRTLNMNLEDREATLNLEDRDATVILESRDMDLRL
jgi:hypothetical protein